MTKIGTVYSVDGIRLALNKSNPPQLVIRAKDQVPTAGWSDGRLSPYVYIRPPTDGIYEFDFVASAPEGMVAQAFEAIDAEYTWPDPPVGLHGVRVYASSNSKEAHFGTGNGKVCVRGKLTDEGVECQTMRAEDDTLYTLVGDLEGLRIGDRVHVVSTIAEFSFCMQGTTIAVDWIAKELPRAAK